MKGSRLECRQGWLEAWQEPKTTLSAHPRPCHWHCCLSFIYRKEVKVLSGREHPPLPAPPGSLTLSKEENENCSGSGVVDRPKKQRLKGDKKTKNNGLRYWCARQLVRGRRRFPRRMGEGKRKKEAQLRDWIVCGPQQFPIYHETSSK